MAVADPRMLWVGLCVKIRGSAKAIRGYFCTEDNADTSQCVTESLSANLGTGSWCRGIAAGKF
ncbi:hypothetical protein [Rubripirellula obstinata]|uniref:hypothetical protein n=1 Tax=Rubripirellula obstinata TaxID=406547 RepID=UPI001390395B|nr:hypothetical protein [Rubripirellula obstinata]